MKTRFPKRPLAFFVTLFFAFLLLTLTIPIGVSKILLIVFSALFLLSLLFFLIFSVKFLRGVSVTLFFVILAISSVLFIHLPKIENARALDGEYVSGEGRVVERSIGENYTTLIIDTKNVGGGQKVSLIMINPDNTPDVWQRISFSGKASFSYDKYSKGKEAFLTVFSNDFEIIPSSNPFDNLMQNLRSLVRSSFSHSPSGAMLSSLVIGDKSGLDEGLEEDFRKLGLSHLLSISGLHLTIVAMSLYFSLLRVGMGNKGATLLSSLLAFLYMAMTGFSISVLRAGQMMLIFLLSRLIRRQNDSITSLFSAGFFITLISPFSLFNTGFQLSFSATFGILVFLPPIMKRVSEKTAQAYESGNAPTLKEKIIIKIKTYVTLSTMSTLSATLATLPVTFLTFNEVALMSVLSNLFIIFFAKYFLILSFVAVALSLLKLDLIALLASKVCDLIYLIMASVTKLLCAISPKPLSLNPSFLLLGVVLVTAVFLVGTLFSKKGFSLIISTLSALFLVLVLNVASSAFLYSDFVVDLVNKSGERAMLVTHQRETVYIDQTATNSKRFTFIEEVFDKRKISSVDEALFLTLDVLPSERIKEFISSYKTEKLTLVTDSFSEWELYEIEELCRERKVVFSIVYLDEYDFKSGVSTSKCEGWYTLVKVSKNNSAIVFAVDHSNEGYYPQVTADVVITDRSDLLSFRIGNNKVYKE